TCCAIVGKLCTNCRASLRGRDAPPRRSRKRLRSTFQIVRSIRQVTPETDKIGDPPQERQSMVKPVNHAAGSDHLARLHAIRRFPGAVATQGLPDQTIAAFLDRDPALGAALERAGEELRRLEETSPALLSL